MAQAVVARRASRLGMAVLAMALIANGAVLASGGKARAFDPKKVFKEEKPSAKKLFRFYLKKKEEGDEDEALDVLQYAAEQGNQTAQWKLGKMYESGDSVARDPAKAFEFYKRIADHYGEARPNTPEWAITGKAMVALGHYYSRGMPEAGITVDQNEARVMYTTAAMYFRDSDAQFELGKLLLEGENTQEEARQGIRMLQLADQKGHVGALALLGHALVEGEYVQQDVVRGLTMLTRANEKATPDMLPWINGLQQEAFALASVEQRQQAIAAVQSQ
ncbi:MAG: sel1 repeat family protein [Nitratireductor sp.]|nr:sel1 repeat family protein [Nitratireductor sp.]